MLLDDDAAVIYARVLIAIARADGEISPEEGCELERVIALRTSAPVSVAELMFAPALQPVELSRALAGSAVGAGPFRAAPIDLVEISRTLIDDALAIVLAKGSISSGEEASLVRFSTALGIETPDVRARIAAASRG